MRHCDVVVFVVYSHWGVAPHSLLLTHSLSAALCAAKRSFRCVHITEISGSPAPIDHRRMTLEEALKQTHCVYAYMRCGIIPMQSPTPIPSNTAARNSRFFTTPAPAPRCHGRRGKGIRGVG